MPQNRVSGVKSLLQLTQGVAGCWHNSLHQWKGETLSAVGVGILGWSLGIQRSSFPWDVILASQTGGDNTRNSLPHRSNSQDLGEWGEPSEGLKTSSLHALMCAQPQPGLKGQNLCDGCDSSWNVHSSSPFGLCLFKKWMVKDFPPSMPLCLWGWRQDTIYHGLFQIFSDGLKSLGMLKLLLHRYSCAGKSKMMGLHPEPN